MDIEKALDQVKENIENGTEPTLIIGRPGTGLNHKTRELAEEMNMSVCNFIAPEVEKEEILGLLTFGPEQKHFFTEPSIIKAINKAASQEGRDGCMVILDDFLETSPQTLVFLKALIKDREMSGWKLNGNVHFVALSTAFKKDEAFAIPLEATL